MRSSRLVLLLVVMLAALALPAAASAHRSHGQSMAWLLQGSRVSESGGWLLVHIEGTPYQIGFQNGYLAADSAHTWVHQDLWAGGSYRQWSDQIARDYVWPKIPAEYQQELRGIAAGLHAAGYTQDSLWDVVAANAWADISVYDPAAAASASALTAASALSAPAPAGDHCSAFVATGDATTDGEIVMAHSTWSGYVWDQPFNVMFDVHPFNGIAFRMQSAGGQIWSGCDWYSNDAGLMVCETTLWDPVVDPAGSPIFVRAREAIQYADGIDSWLGLMLDENSGAYPNEWLVGDSKTGEICSLQLGCKQWDITRTFDGILTSCNWAWGENFQQEAGASTMDLRDSGRARWVRWGQLKDEWYGKIDADAGMTLLGDTYDVYLERDVPSYRTICGEGEHETVLGADAGGATDGKVTTSSLTDEGMATWIRWGHPNGDPFDVDAFLAENPWWLKDYTQYDLKVLRAFAAETPNPWVRVGEF